MNGTFEIFTNKEWMILPSFVHGILPTVMNNANNHTMLGIDREKKNPMCINASGDDIFREYEVTDDGQVLPVYDGWNGIDYLRDLKQPFVNVIPIDGPITRNGGACSYGSKDIRDWMMKASDNPFCQCHVLTVNTPGGSAWAKNDFQQGIDYAHSKGQRVIAFIDGLCASAGMYLASLCDEVYVMNLKDQLGCVGVMASFFTMKSGDKNEFTGETYREYYDPESVDKNKEMRDIAEDDDATLLIAELKKLGDEFRADMKAAFPKAEVDEHLKGKIFDAKDVMGILCDGQMMLGEVIGRVFDLANGSAQPIERTAGRKIGKVQKPSARSGRMQAGAAKENILSTQLNTINMTEKYQTIAQLAGAADGKFEKVDADGVYMNTSLLDTLQTNIEAMQQEKADALALVESLTSEKNDLTAKVEELNADIEAKNLEIGTLTENAGKADEQLNAKDEEIATLKADAEKAATDMTAKDEEIAKLQGDMECKQKDLDEKTAAIEAKETELTAAKEELEDAKASLTTAEGTIAERDQQISDLNAQITELQHNPGAEPAAGAAPQNNGGGADAPGVAVNQYVYDPNLSYEENGKAEKAWNEAHGK